MTTKELKYWEQAKKIIGKWSCRWNRSCWIETVNNKKYLAFKVPRRKTLFTPEHLFESEYFTGWRVTYFASDDGWGRYIDNYKKA
jgi:hypothetical protein